MRCFTKSKSTQLLSSWKLWFVFDQNIQICNQTLSHTSLFDDEALIGQNSSFVWLNFGPKGGISALQLYLTIWHARRSISVVFYSLITLLPILCIRVYLEAMYKISNLNNHNWISSGILQLWIPHTPCWHHSKFLKVFSVLFTRRFTPWILPLLASFSLSDSYIKPASSWFSPLLHSTDTGHRQDLISLFSDTD